MNREVICFDAVAPARERGLKSCVAASIGLRPGRSREGAWIEIVAVESNKVVFCGRSREGAWIEIGVSHWYDPAPRVAPARERG